MDTEMNEKSPPAGGLLRYRFVRANPMISQPQDRNYPPQMGQRSVSKKRRRCPDG